MSEFCNQFYRTYFLNIEQEIFAVLTDTFHKPGFKLHVLVLQHLFCLVKFQTLSHNFISFVPFLFFCYKSTFIIVLYCQVDSGRLTEPLWDASAVPLPYPNNTMYVRDCTIKLLGSSFPNMTPAEVQILIHFLLFVLRYFIQV